MIVNSISNLISYVSMNNENYNNKLKLHQNYILRYLLTTSNMVNLQNTDYYCCYHT